MIRLLILVALTVLISSCTENPKNVFIFIDSEFIQNNSVIIDNKIKLEQLYVSEKMFNEFKIKTGKHTVLINDSIIKEFTVEGDSGILNISEREFVIFPIEYSSSETYTSLSTTVRCPVIIDSLIIYDPYLAIDQTQLLSKLKDPNFKDQLSNKTGKITGEMIFIPKTWDFFVDETLPDEISIRADSTAVKTEYKMKIASAEQFLLYAVYSEDYKVELIEYEELKELIMNI